MQDSQFENSPLRCEFMKSEVNLKTSLLDVESEISVPVSVRKKSSVEFSDPTGPA